MPGMAQRIWTTHTPAAQPVCAHADTAYAAAGETRSRTCPIKHESPRSQPITYPHRDIQDSHFPTPRAEDQSRHARNRGWMLLLAYSFILSRSMFEGHLLNFRGYVLGFSNKPFDKWQHTNRKTATFISLIRVFSMQSDIGHTCAIKYNALLLYYMYELIRFCNNKIYCTLKIYFCNS